MILYTENPKEYKHTPPQTALLELLNDTSKVVGYKTRLYFLHTSNEQLKLNFKK